MYLVGFNYKDLTKPTSACLAFWWQTWQQVLNSSNNLHAFTCNLTCIQYHLHDGDRDCINYLNISIWFRHYVITFLNAVKIL